MPMMNFGGMGGSAPAGGGLGGLVGKVGKAIGTGGLSVIGGAIGGLFSGMGENKKAKIAAQNQNAANAWQHKLNTAQYDTEQMPYRQQSAKMRGWRDALMRGVMRNPNNGLSKLFAGWDDGKSTAFNAGQDVRAVTNPFAAAGAPPRLKAESGGWQSAIGGALKGIFG